jgi:hypothetical protein
MIKKITFDTYPITLHVFIDETDEAILEYLMINQCDDYQDLIDHPLSDNIEEDASEVYLRFRNLNKLEIIAHEALHATAYILRHVGIRFSKNSEEAYAYLLQYIVENILD